MKTAFFPFAFVLSLALAGCSALPDKPARQAMYDFGPAPAATAPASRGAPLVLAEVQAEGALETTGLMYRLAYDDPYQLRPYAFARWSAAPAELLRQRLRDVIGRERPVLDQAAAGSLRQGGSGVPVLRVALEEFSQQFSAPTSSEGVLRLRCTLVQGTGPGERVVAQRSFEVRRPAPTADAAGGVRALTAAVDAAATDIAHWLAQP